MRRCCRADDGINFSVARQRSHILIKRISSENERFSSEITDPCARFFCDNCARSMIPHFFRAIRSGDAHKTICNSFSDECILALAIQRNGIPSQSGRRHDASHALCSRSTFNGIADTPSWRSVFWPMQSHCRIWQLSDSICWLELPRAMTFQCGIHRSILFVRSDVEQIFPHHQRRTTQDADGRSFILNQRQAECVMTSAAKSFCSINRINRPPCRAFRLRVICKEDAWITRRI